MFFSAFYLAIVNLLIESNANFMHSPPATGLYFY